MRLAAIGVSSEVLSGILNCVCPDRGGKHGWNWQKVQVPGENVRRAGVHSGSNSYPPDSTVRQESDHTELIE